MTYNNNGNCNTSVNINVILHAVVKPVHIGGHLLIEHHINYVVSAASSLVADSQLHSYLNQCKHSSGFSSVCLS